MTKSRLLLGAAVLAVLFGPHSVAALNAAAELAGVHINWPGLPTPVNVPAVSLTAAGIWLLIRARRTRRSGAAWYATALALAGIVLLPHPGEAADTAATLLLTGAGAWLCAQAARQGGAPPWHGRLMHRWDRKAFTACAVVLAGHTLAGSAESWLAALGPAVADQAAQADATGLHNPVMFAAQALAAGAREEIPLLALPAALMVAARRSAWQILLVVCVLRAVPYAYLGAPALASAVFAAAALWMYRVTGRVGPIIVGHMLFNALALIGGQVGSLLLTASLVVAVLLLGEVPEALPERLRWIYPAKRAVGDRTATANGPAAVEAVATEPAKAPPQPKAAPQRRDFATAMHAMYSKSGPAADKRKILIIPALFLAAGTGLGAAARAGLPPACATVVTSAVAALIGAGAVYAVCVLFLCDPLQNVDWDSADAYEHKLTASLHPDARAALASAQERVHRRFPAAERVHVYRPDLPDHSCTLDTDGCHCVRLRFAASTHPNRRHPIIIVGERLLDRPAILTYVLAHETNHIRRPWLQVYFLLQLVGVAGWLGMGLLLPWPVLLVAAPTVWAATMALVWANELAADTAARTAGLDAALGYWTMRRAAQPTRTGLARLTAVLSAVLAPTHPPMALRAALANRIAHRP